MIHLQSCIEDFNYVMTSKEKNRLKHILMILHYLKQILIMYVILIRHAFILLKKA